jgi:hypothetical protein
MLENKQGYSFIEKYIAFEDKIPWVPAFAGTTYRLLSTANQQLGSPYRLSKWQNSFNHAEAVFQKVRSFSR